MTTTIPILARDGTVRARVTVDTVNAEGLCQWRWHLAAGRYAARSQRFGQGRKRMVYMHRQILGVDEVPGVEVDHINGDPLDNRLENLRLADRSQNSQNRASVPGTASRYRNVTWSKKHTRWVASVRLKGRQVYLGLFDDEDEAGAVAAEWRAEHMPYANPDRAVAVGHPSEEAARQRVLAAFDDYVAPSNVTPLRRAQ